MVSPNPSERTATSKPCILHRATCGLRALIKHLRNRRRLRVLAPRTVKHAF